MKIIKFVAALVLPWVLSLWAILRIIMDWVGRSTFGDDWANLVATMPEWLAWVYGTPWWVPGILSTACVVALIYWLFRDPPPVLRANPEKQDGPYWIDNNNVAKLAAQLSKTNFTGDRINVLYNPSFSDSLDLADKISDAVSAAGVPCAVHQGGMFDHDPKDRGLFVYFGTDHAESAQALVNALADVGFLAVKRDVGTPSNNPFIYVARPPKS